MAQVFIMSNFNKEYLFSEQEEKNEKKLKTKINKTEII